MWSRSTKIKVIVGILGALVLALVLFLWLRQCSCNLPSAQDLADACRFTGELTKVLLTPASSIHGELEAELEKIRQAGEPLTMVAAAPSEVPEGENAAALYQRAFERLDLPQRGTDSYWEFLMSTNQPLESNTPLHTTMGQLVAKNTAAIELLEAAANRPACRFPVDWSVPGADSDFGHRNNLTNCAILLSAKTILDAEQGQMGQVLGTVRVSLALGEAIRDEPIITSQLRSLALDRIALSALEAALSERPAPTDSCKKLHGYVSQMEFVDAFVHSFWGERAAGIEFFDLVRHDRAAVAPIIEHWGRGVQLKLYLDHFWGAKILDRDEIVYLGVMSEYVNAAGKYWRQHPNVSDVEGAIWKTMPRVSPVTSGMLGVLRGTARKRDRTIARVGLARVALALKAYKNKKGEYPQSLAQLGEVIEWADLPEDPFSGEDFIYRREGEGFLVYSIGVDLEDDGGKAEEDWEEGDIVWRCAK